MALATMWTAAAVCVLVPWVAVSAQDAAEQPSATTRRPAEHYLVERADGPLSRDEILKVAEAVYERLSAEFAVQGVPPKRLPIRVMLDDDLFQTELSIRGAPPLDVPRVGWYSGADTTVLVRAYHDAYRTREVLIHELVHQFLHVMVQGEQRAPQWCEEGYAEWTAMHLLRDGTLEFGVRGEFLRRALASTVGRALAGEIEISPMLDWRGRSHYGDVGVFMSFLRERKWDDDAVRRWVMDLLRGIDAPAPASEAGEPVWKSWDREFSEYVRSLRRPWSVLWGDWRSAGDVIVGEASAWGVLEPVPRARAASRVRCTAASERGDFGFAVRFDRDDVLCRVVVSPSRGVVELMIRNIARDKWSVLASATVERTRDWTLDLRREGPTTLVVDLGGNAAIRHKFLRQWEWGGLVVYGGSTRFLDVVVE